MRTTSLALNSIVVVFFISFLAYTFAARQHLDSLAREFVTDKTLEYSQPVMELAGETLDSPLVQKFLSDDHTAVIRGEITDYGNDPSAYISDLTRQQLDHPKMANWNPAIEKVVTIKNKIRTFYDDTLNALISDLRIFASSNLLAGLLAFVLAFRSSSNIRKPIAWFSILMFVAVLFCSYLYIDGLTFFRIIFQTHMGWWYAVSLCVVVAALQFDYGLYAKKSKQGSESASEATEREESKTV